MMMLLLLLFSFFFLGCAVSVLPYSLCLFPPSGSLLLPLASFILFTGALISSCLLLVQAQAEADKRQSTPPQAEIELGRLQVSTSTITLYSALF